MIVARGITTVFQIDFIATTLLGIVAYHIAFALLTLDIGDDTLFAVEVVAYGLSFVRGIAFFKNRNTFGNARRIGNTMGKYRTTVHVHRDDIGREFYLLIIDFSTSIQVRESSLRESNRVIGFISDRSLQLVFLRNGCIWSDCQRVCER